MSSPTHAANRMAIVPQLVAGNVFFFPIKKQSLRYYFWSAFRFFLIQSELLFFSNKMPDIYSLKKIKIKNLPMFYLFICFFLHNQNYFPKQMPYIFIKKISLENFIKKSKICFMFYLFICFFFFRTYFFCSVALYYYCSRKNRKTHKVFFCAKSSAISSIKPCHPSFHFP